MFRSAIATDVAIVGGGPAGAAASLTLARYTDRGCVLIEASDYSAPRIGETVSPALLPLLDYLGAPRPAADVMFACNGSEAAWGGAAAERSSIFSGEGPGWTLDRRRFDASLADAAEARGVTVLRRTVLRAAEPVPDGGWRLRLDSSGMCHALTARQVIDASGRGCAFARRAGAARQGNDRLVGIAAYLRCAPETPAARSILIEAAPDGWWYATALPGDRAVLVYMTDADLIRASGEAADRLFARKRAETELVGARFAAAAPVAAPRVHPAESRRLLPSVGSGWIAAGDAAASFDPLSSLGIGHALASGIQAARILDARLDGDEAMAASYPGDIERIRAEHDRRRAALYAAEHRWPERPFWRRRAVTTAPPALAEAGSIKGSAFITPPSTDQPTAYQ